MLFSTRVRLAVGTLSFCALSAQAQTTVPATTAAPAAAVPTPAATTAPATSGVPDAKLLPPTLVPGNYKTYLNKRYADDKEARAAIHLYSRKSTSGAFWLLGGGAFVGFIASQTGTTVSSTGTRTNTVTPLGYAIAGGIPAIIAIVRFSRYGNDALYKILAEYDNTHMLPGKVVSSIKKSDYK